MEKYSHIFTLILLTQLILVALSQKRPGQNKLPLRQERRTDLFESRRQPGSAFKPNFKKLPQFSYSPRAFKPNQGGAPQNRRVGPPPNIGRFPQHGRGGLSRPIQRAVPRQVPRSRQRPGVSRNPRYNPNKYLSSKLGRFHFPRTQVNPKVAIRPGEKAPFTQNRLPKLPDKYFRTEGLPKNGGPSAG